MKILKHGNTYKKRQCNKCEALLEYNDMDIKKSSREYIYDGEYHCDYKKYIICPECGQKLILTHALDGEVMVNYET